MTCRRHESPNWLRYFQPDHDSSLQTYRLEMMIHPDLHMVVSPWITVVSRGARAPCGIGAVAESAQATTVNTTVAPRSDKRRDLIDIQRSMRVIRCIYSALC